MSIHGVTRGRHSRALLWRPNPNSQDPGRDLLLGSEKAYRRLPKKAAGALKKSNNNALGYDVDVPNGDAEMNYVQQTMNTILSHAVHPIYNRLLWSACFCSAAASIRANSMSGTCRCIWTSSIGLAAESAGMSQFGDGGIGGTKSYRPSGHHIT